MRRLTGEAVWRTAVCGRRPRRTASRRVNGRFGFDEAGVNLTASPAGLAAAMSRSAA